MAEKEGVDSARKDVEKFMKENMPQDVDQQKVGGAPTSEELEAYYDALATGDKPVEIEVGGKVPMIDAWKKIAAERAKAGGEVPSEPFELSEETKVAMDKAVKEITNTLGVDYLKNSGDGKWTVDGIIAMWKKIADEMDKAAQARIAERSGKVFTSSFAQVMREEGAGQPPGGVRT